MIFRLLLLFLCFGMVQPVLAQLRAQDGITALEAGDNAAALSIWTPLAERGDVLAQYNLGVLLATGEADSADLQLAQHWFEAAALQNHLGAQQALADLLASQQKWDAARHWYTIAALAGAARAQFSLGKMLERGLGGPSDPQQAVAWYQAAAEQGLRDAQFALGAALAELGEVEAATDWFEAAALQGHVTATHNLALALSRGIGRDQDMSMARQLYLTAAAVGYAPSFYNLALMQAQGRGGPQDFRKALALAIVSDRLGHDGAWPLIDALHEVMAPDVIRQAEALADECQTDPGICG